MHTPIDYLQDLGSEVAPSFKLTEIIELQNGTLRSPLYVCMYVSIYQTQKQSLRYRAQLKDPRDILSQLEGTLKAVLAFDHSINT